MARRCALTGKGVMVGNNVSHANNKTKRRFLPNLRRQSLFSETLGENVRLRISANAMRTVEHRGGLDGYLLEPRDADLPGDLRRLKRRIQAARAAAEGHSGDASLRRTRPPRGAVRSRPARWPCRSRPWWPWSRVPTSRSSTRSMSG